MSEKCVKNLVCNKNSLSFICCQFCVEECDKPCENKCELYPNIGSDEEEHF
jgi:hypothetical protein